MAETARLIAALGLDRNRLRDDLGFVGWRDSHPTLDLDGRTLFVRGGDMLADEDQLILEWAVRAGWTSEEALRNLSKLGPGENGPTGDFDDVEGEPE